MTEASPVLAADVLKLALLYNQVPDSPNNLPEGQFGFANIPPQVYIPDKLVSPGKKDTGSQGG
jgi:hypothetical protein